MIIDWLTSAGLAFVAIAPVELPDKTFVATLVLTTRYRPLPVWLGVASAFAVHCAVAVLAGSLVALLPATPVRLLAAALFATGAVIMFRGARRASTEADESEYAEQISGGRTGFAAFGASFLLLATAEWGDLSQLFTMGLVASGEPAAAVFAGAWLALATVSGAAVLLGRWIQRRVRLSVVRYVAAAVCAALAVLTAVSAFA
ncbi:MAG TPA: TMEM165/GDT1 family protein [Natronosporangium sp.]|nr:TMEM165/GDT1 family protein [Natronosporangium sp.]